MNEVQYCTATGQCARLSVEDTNAIKATHGVGQAAAAAPAMLFCCYYEWRTIDRLVSDE